jgi:cold shock CspA family protein/ribosome-associated translation inhibitor RaiA
MDRSEYVENAILEKVDKLEGLAERLTSCRVAVEALHRHHHKGHLYRVRIDLTLPGKELVVGHEGHDKHAHEDVYVAVRDAFNAMQRRLQKSEDKRRPNGVKTHEAPDTARVIRLFPDQSYGFLETPDGTDVYFHANAVANEAFKELEVGSEVRFTLGELDDEKGPHASTVHVIGKHHVAG